MSGSDGEQFVSRRWRTNKRPPKSIEVLLERVRQQARDEGDEDLISRANSVHRDAVIVANVTASLVSLVFDISND
jgi:hypothetical protein